MSETTTRDSRASTEDQAKAKYMDSLLKYPYITNL